MTKAQFHRTALDGETTLSKTDFEHYLEADQTQEIVH